MLKRAGLLCAAVALGATTGPATGQLPCSYTVTVLPNSPCFNGASPANPVAINNLGHALLTGLNCGNGYSESYVWVAGDTALTRIIRPVGMLGFTATDINDNDVIVGEAEFATMGKRAVIYDHGTWTYLPPLNPPMGWSSASAINNNNQVCGYRSIGGPSDPVNPQTAFIWTNGVFADFGLWNGRSTAAWGLNASAMATVSAGVLIANAYASLWWDTGSLALYPPGCIGSNPGRINDAGVACVEGMVQQNPLVTRSFSYRNGVFSDVWPLPGTDRIAMRRISSSGLIAGASITEGSPSVWKGCIWVDGQAIDLTTIVPGFTGTFRDCRISRNGRIIAEGRINDTNRTFVLQPVSVNGDTNCDGVIGVADLLQVINAWGPCLGCRADVNGDSNVDVIDLLLVINNWGNSG